jgi:sugar lactone lactonase YvrE
MDGYPGGVRLTKLSTQDGNFTSNGISVIHMPAACVTNVSSLNADRKGNLWIETVNWGLCRFDPMAYQFNRIIVNPKEHNYPTNNAV